MTEAELIAKDRELCNQMGSISLANRLPSGQFFANLKLRQELSCRITEIRARLAELRKK